MSLATGIVALGTTQADAQPLRAKFNYISTAAASTGVILPNNCSIGDQFFVRNAGANAVNVYPPVGGAIDGGTVNAAQALAATNMYRFVYEGNGNFSRFV